jgi:hypothetical protein
MMIVGLIWAVFAPAMLVFTAWFLYFTARKTNLLGRMGMVKNVRRNSILISISIPLFLMLAFYVPDRMAFRAVCKTIGEPMIFRTEKVDGFYLNSGTASSFGMQYLREPGFEWIEINSIYNRGKFTRYTRIPIGNDFDREEIDGLTATHMVKEIFNHGPMVSTYEILISRRDTGEILARAKRASFLGGRARWVLGAYGMAKCPSPFTTEGSIAADKMFHLAWETLNPE